MSVTTRGGLSPARVSLLVLAIGQLISPLWFYLGNSALQTGRPGTPPIVPAGYTFTIWAAICIFAAAYAVWQLPRRSGPTDPTGANDRLLDDLAWPLAGVFAGFSLWLVFSAADLVWLTVAVFAGMLALLLQALRKAHGARSRIVTWSRTGRTLLWGTLGTYAGWTSVAVWVNLTTALADTGAPTTGVPATLGQLGILAAATATACVVTVRTNGLLPAAAAAAWALLGASIGAATANAPLLAAVAAAGLVVLGVVTAASRRRAMSPA